MWSTTYAPLAQYGLKIKLMDIDIDTLNFDIEQLSAAISEKTRLIFAVNLLGNLTALTAYLSLIADRDMLLIEDNLPSVSC